MRNLRKGFTLIELLVVISIIALLIAIMLPSVLKAQTTASTMQCLSNVRGINQGVSMYLNDSQQVYPAASGNALLTVNLVGKAGTSSSSGGNVPAEDRLLFDYLNSNTETAECPLDSGSNSPSTGSCYDYFGSSYVYLDRNPLTDLRSRDNVWAIEGHRVTEVKVPTKKAVVFDFNLIRSINYAQNEWHPLTGDLLRGSMGFADGHATEVEYKIDGGNGYTGTMSAQIDNWASADPYY